MAFYPTLKAKKLNINTIIENTKFCAGFGLCIPLNQMVTIMLYYNAFNLNTARKGDFERKGFINVNLGFF